MDRDQLRTWKALAIEAGADTDMLHTLLFRGGTALRVLDWADVAAGRGNGYDYNFWSRSYSTALLLKEDGLLEISERRDFKSFREKRLDPWGTVFIVMPTQERIAANRARREAPLRAEWDGLLGWEQELIGDFDAYRRLKSETPR